MPFASLDEIRRNVGQEVGVSGWLEVGQQRIQMFADATEDWQFLHVDEEAAAKSRFGGTVAHGFLSLSLLSRLAYEGMVAPEGSLLTINYGLDKVRFLAPVRSNKRIRGRFAMLAVDEKAPGQILIRYAVTVEIEDEERPALVAEWLVLFQTQGE